MNVLILNSAQSKYPVGNDQWVKGTIRAMQSLKTNNIHSHILCSTEPSPWNLVTYLAGKSSMKVKLIIKSKEDKSGRIEFSRLIEEYTLNENLTQPIFLGEGSSGHPKELWPKRDRLALTLADEVYPVSIRPGGRLDTLLREIPFTAKVRNDFRIDWTKPGRRLVYNFENSPVNLLPPGEWLIHWTHTSPGPWQGEKAWEYYRDLVASPENYVRSAQETLIRIITEQKIRSTTWRFPDNEPAVSFTSLDPGDAVKLMRWRKRFVRYSFEPFGIGIKKSILVKMGAGEVTYRNGRSCLATPNRFFSQSAGKQGDWTREKEWRIRNDLCLGVVECKEMIIIVPDKVSYDYVKSRIKHNVLIHVLFASNPATAPFK
ncbi:hypothetical protein ACFL1R_12845 [Candidatus Latescibacterota bacterium]